ncbi:baseplate J/gp47 family protein [Sphingomonas sp. DT-204]|uniref:baseplate J/gp47 family protein n=1 Tax=Sphingomonas sp. DT-204 TaxID=3396166 RepID=UPI003F1DC01E
MPLPSPRLDDRTFKQLVDQALAQASATCPEWTDHNPADPGRTLLELFAYLTEAMLYRLNRVPAKLYVALLNLAGVELRPPSAAATTLTFSRGGSSDAAVTIPAGTQVATGDGSVVFATAAAATLEKGADSVDVPALHCAVAEAELIGTSSGQPGQSLAVRRPPVIAPSGDGLDFILAVEAAEGEDLENDRSFGVGDKTYRIWSEAESFADVDPDARVYRLDRAQGRVQFAPAIDETGTGARAVAALPPAGREIRAWYRTGGGSAGNVSAGALKLLKNAPAGVTVANAHRAAGGADAETLEDALTRGPIALSSLRCAVTARDYEHVALSTGGVARARAYAQAQAWSHADPGVVEVQIIPSIDVAGLPDRAVTAPVIGEHRREELRQRVAAALDERRPLGVRTAVVWARVRPVAVAARIVVGREIDRTTAAQAVRERINALLSPLRDLPFGHELRAADVYEAIMNQAGVRYADQLRFTIGEAPDRDIAALVRDPHQPGCWFAGGATGLYRSLDDADSWATVLAKEGEAVRFVAPHSGRAGVIAVGIARAKGGAVHVSYDLGETWQENAAAFDVEVFDADWIERDGQPLLLIATAQGLRQLAPRGTAGPVPVSVDKAIDTKGFYAVASTTSPSGVISVAVAAREEGGVHLSAAGGVSETFRSIGLKGKDVRVLAVQHASARAFLWAGLAAEAGEQGEGAYRTELRADGANDPDGFQPFNVGWQGGSCQALAFADTTVFAGSNRAGVLWMDGMASKPSWTAVRLDAGLPIRDTERLLHVVAAVAAAPQPGGAPLVLSAGPIGVHRSSDGGDRFTLSSATVFTERIPLPPGWLYCADTHDIQVASDEEAWR